MLKKYIKIIIPTADSCLTTRVCRNLRQAYLLEVGLTQILADHEALSIACHVELHVLLWAFRPSPSSVKWTWTVSAFSINESSYMVMVMGLQPCVWSGPTKGFESQGAGLRVLVTPQSCLPQVGANCQNQSQNACKQFMESIILQKIAQDWKSTTLQILGLLLKMIRARVVMATNGGRNLVWWGDCGRTNACYPMFSSSSTRAGHLAISSENSEYVTNTCVYVVVLRRIPRKNTPEQIKIKNKKWRGQIYTCPFSRISFWVNTHWSRW